MPTTDHILTTGVGPVRVLAVAGDLAVVEMASDTVQGATCAAVVRIPSLAIGPAAQADIVPRLISGQKVMMAAEPSGHGCLVGEFFIDGVPLAATQLRSTPYPAAPVGYPWSSALQSLRLPTVYPWIRQVHDTIYFVFGILVVLFLLLTLARRHVAYEAARAGKSPGPIKRAFTGWFGLGAESFRTHVPPEPPPAATREKK
jgi:hypothetical protein